MAGGGPGAFGRNTWIKKCRPEDGDMPDENDKQQVQMNGGTRVINIGGKATIMMGKGDKLVVETPGGGAWGAKGEGEDLENVVEEDWKHEWSPRGSLKDREARQAEF